MGSTHCGKMLPASQKWYEIGLNVERDPTVLRDRLIRRSSLHAPNCLSHRRFMAWTFQAIDFLLPNVSSKIFTIAHWHSMVVVDEMSRPN